MKTPLIIRPDGTAYRLTLHDDHPVLPKLGTEVDGFLLESAQVYTNGSCGSLWVLQEEFRKPPADNRSPVERGFDDLKLLAANAYREDRFEDKVKLDMAACAFRYLEKERDGFKKVFDQVRPADAPYKEDPLADQLAHRLDYCGNSITFSRDTVMQIWKRLLRSKP